MLLKHEIVLIVLICLAGSASSDKIFDATDFFYARKSRLIQSIVSWGSIRPVPKLFPVPPPRPRKILEELQSP